MPPRAGSIPGGPPQGLPSRPPFGLPPPGQFPPGQNGNASLSASVDDLIASATGQAPTPTEAAPEKKSKKDKNIKLVYFDDTISPEEKMAALGRYAGSVRT